MHFLKILTLPSGSHYLFTDDQTMKTMKHHKDLGVLVTNNLIWSDHINYICSSAYRSFHLIHHSILRKCLYFTLVHSRLTYCFQVWRPRLIKDIVFLERVQRHATKYILNDYYTDYGTRLISLHLLPLVYWLELQDLMFLIKCFKDPTDESDISNHVSLFLHLQEPQALNISSTTSITPPRHVTSILIE